VDGFVDLAVVVADGSPVVIGGGVDGAEGGGNGFEIGEFLDGFVHHGFEAGGLDVGEVFIKAFDGETEAGGEVFFIAYHDVDALGNAAVDFLGAFLAADAFPEAGAVVEVVADDGAVAFGGFDGFDNDFWCGVAESSEDAAGMEPADAECPEDVVPIKVSGLELTSSGVAAVWDADSTADAESSFGEVKAVAHGASDAVVRDPFDEAGVDAALEDEVFDQAANGVIRKGGGDGGAEAEAAAEAAGDVVLSAAFPSGELSGDADAALARVKAEHDFSEGEAVVGAGVCWFEFEFHRAVCQAWWTGSVKWDSPGMWGWGLIAGWLRIGRGMSPLLAQRLGAALMALGIGLGAFGAHALKTRVEPEQIEVWKTAVFYHVLHAVVICLLGVMRQGQAGLPYAVRLLVVGMAVFSGSLYALVLSGQRWLGAVTPLGGVLLILGWLWLAWRGFEGRCAEDVAR
jgi:uncharacterized membrane protein YgdD (TMEM256/DUF423 family)